MIFQPRPTSPIICLLTLAFLATSSWAEGWDREPISDELVAHAVLQTSSAVFLLNGNDAILRGSDYQNTTSVYQASERLNALGYDENDTVVAVGNNGYIVRSTDAGSNWQAATLSEPLLGDLHGVAYGSGNWVAVGTGADGMAVLRSTDGGANWNQMGSPGQGELRAVAWNGSQFYAAGGDLFDGVLLSSGNGSSWASVSVGAAALLHFIATDSAGALLAGGEAGTLLRSDANGANVQAVANDVSGFETLRTAVAVGQGHWLVGGDQLIVLEVLAAGEAELIHGPADGAPPVEALLITGADSYVIFGDFESLFRPLELRVEESLSGRVSVRVQNLIWGERYILQRSGNLSDWQTEESFAADGLTRTWSLDVPSGQQSYFYRVIPE